MRRFLLDQGPAPYAAAILREEGFDAVHVSEIGMERCEQELKDGAAVSANRKAIRVRRLPLR